MWDGRFDGTWREDKFNSFGANGIRECCHEEGCNAEIKKVIPARDPKQCVCVRSVSRKSRDLDAFWSRAVMVVMK